MQIRTTCFIAWSVLSQHHTNVSHYRDNKKRQNKIENHRSSQVFGKRARSLFSYILQSFFSMQSSSTPLRFDKAPAMLPGERYMYFPLFHDRICSWVNLSLQGALELGQPSSSPRTQELRCKRQGGWLLTFSPCTWGKGNLTTHCPGVASRNAGW